VSWLALRLVLWLLLCWLWQLWLYWAVILGGGLSVAACFAMESEAALVKAGFAPVPASWLTSIPEADGSLASSIEHLTTYTNYIQEMPAKQPAKCDVPHDSGFGKYAAVPTADIFASKIHESITMGIDQPFRVMTDCSGMEAPFYSLMKLTHQVTNV